MSKCWILDLESLGKFPDSVVLSFGMVFFDLTNVLPTRQQVESTGFYRKLVVNDQLKKGRSTHPETIDWWKQQGEEAKHVLKPSDDDVSIVEFHSDLKDWLKKNSYDFKNDFIWIRGPQYDAPMITDLFEMYELKNPMNFWKVRDIRTLIDISTGSRDGKIEISEDVSWCVKHHALHDCVLDYLSFKELYKGSDDE